MWDNLTTLLSADISASDEELLDHIKITLKNLTPPSSPPVSQFFFVFSFTYFSQKIKQCSKNKNFDKRWHDNETPAQRCQSQRDCLAAAAAARHKPSDVWCHVYVQRKCQRQRMQHHTADSAIAQHRHAAQQSLPLLSQHQKMPTLASSATIPSSCVSDLPNVPCMPSRHNTPHTSRSAQIRWPHK